MRSLLQIIILLLMSCSINAMDQAVTGFLHFDECTTADDDLSKTNKFAGSFDEILAEVKRQAQEAKNFAEQFNQQHSFSVRGPYQGHSLKLQFDLVATSNGEEIVVKDLRVYKVDGAILKPIYFIFIPSKQLFSSAIPYATVSLRNPPRLIPLFKSESLAIDEVNISDSVSIDNQTKYIDLFKIIKKINSSTVAVAK